MDSDYRILTPYENKVDTKALQFVAISAI